ncbi:hypothetical protein BD410DRAFT_792523 [Rickenella mellea]|uniref:Uncharacterized protein n=1 Tax=Rickenella mellea TaxID=50990 RepID=A0A4Y7PVK6_9AGAM|nr:hypothetical protein BD410DRAFT_792523 [Rickenella mellea]
MNQDYGQGNTHTVRYGEPIVPGLSRTQTYSNHNNTVNHLPSSQHSTHPINPIFRHRTSNLGLTSPHSSPFIYPDIELDPSYGHDYNSGLDLRWDKRLRHPTITPFRLMITCLTAGFGMSKAWLAYRGLPTFPTTLEWVFGVMVTIALFWLGLYEEEAPQSCSWLFEKDMKYVFEADFLLGVLEVVLPILSVIFIVLYYCRAVFTFILAMPFIPDGINVYIQAARDFCRWYMKIFCGIYTFVPIRIIKWLTG